MTINDQVQILLNEFKEEFPYYRDHCLHCAAEGAEYLGEITCTSHLEKDIQRAVRAELRYCSSCSKLSRFVRANDVNSIMQRKYGRCGEYSIAFAAILLIFGLDIRWIYDSSDHVWIEALINNKFIHCDPCEAALNQPLLYSQNWQKSSSLVLAFDKHQAIDLTSFYYPDNSTVATLRKNIHLSPELISSILSQYNFSASNTTITTSTQKAANNRN
uniref:Transglutaminase-like domain-containing protein n=1 Tax=Aureoumbra lagunensis TaxID=44058 RepID=A0A7S3JQF0_9STRA|mmetsp:Transcript_13488/g.17989  ORF Transcript_13488/g.17989 Transcript_13488/m.17989 type:complete len:216 (-) Transcript_13488:160-807(-)